MIRAALAALLIVLALGPAPAAAEPSAPAIEPRRQPVPATSADTEYDRGVRARVVENWPVPSP